MKRCPKCQEAPEWHFCSNTTRKRADRKRYFVFRGCTHTAELAKTWGIVSNDELATLEVKWNEEAERLFAEMTERWTEPQRVSFRVRLLYIKPASELQMDEEPEAVPKDGEETF